MKRFQHLPTEVEAMHWDGNYDTYKHIANWAGITNVVLNTLSGHITIKGRGLVVNFNDWIIKNDAGELYPCSNDNFINSYREIDNA